jgi:IMP dehydrogenase
MKEFIEKPSRTFNELLLLPGFTSRECTPDRVSLKTEIVKNSKFKLNIPIVSAIMQSVSDDKLAIALAKEGGLSFIFCSQTIESQALMVSKVKKHKAGFVISDTNLKVTDTLEDVLNKKEITKHSTMPVTYDGTCNGVLLGLVTTRDYRVNKMDKSTPVKEFMTPIEDLVCGTEGITLKEANELIFKRKLNVLPVITKSGNLSSLIFRKDYDIHTENHNELLDINKSYMVGAGVNTRDYEKRIPELIKAGADILCIDTSEGDSEFVTDVIAFVRKNYGDDIKIGAGNVVTGKAFRYLAESGADFVKVGIGGGSICITREQKAIGRGQATAVMEVAKARDEYYDETGIYIPICSDGGITQDSQITMALALGADFVMLGRYFARFDEAPGEKIQKSGVFYKEYWGEGSERARNYARYDNGINTKLTFVEGVDSLVPYAGLLKDNINISISIIKSTMCNCGVTTIKDLHENAVVQLVSSMTLREGMAHDVLLKD